MTLYRSPMSPEWRPPLAGGGHCWLIVADPTEHFDTLWRCTSCLAMVEHWQLTEGFWRVAAGAFCPGLVRALDRGPDPGKHAAGVVEVPQAQDVPSDAVGAHPTTGSGP